MIYKKISLILLFMLLSGCDDLETTSQSEVVSLVNLIVSPEYYTERRVRVIGYVRIELESSSIFLSSDDEKHGNLANSFWLELDEDKRVVLNGKENWFLIEGTFTSGNKGHFGLYNGAIVNIERLEELTEN